MSGVNQQNDPFALQYKINKYIDKKQQKKLIITFLFKFVNIGDVVERNYCQHCFRALGRKALFKHSSDITGHQLLCQALVIGDQHDYDQQAIPHREPTPELIRVRTSLEDS